MEELEEIAIDLMGPFPESEDGNKYALVVVDSFFKVDGGACSPKHRGEIALPLDIKLETIQGGDKIMAPEYVQKLQSRLGTCFEELRVQLKKYDEKQRKYYKLFIYGEEYKSGDLVYLREKTR